MCHFVILSKVEDGMGAWRMSWRRQDNEDINHTEQNAGERSCAYDMNTYMKGENTVVRARSKIHRQSSMHTCHERGLEGRIQRDER